MAYDKEELEKQAIKAIKEHNLIFLEDVVCYLPCCRKTFFDHELHELHSIKEAIADNKVRIKQGLRHKWYDGENATTQLALYKLAASQEELDRLTTNKTDHTSKGEKIESITPIMWVDESSKDK